MVAWLLRHSADAAAGFAISLELAAGSLVLGLLIFVTLARRAPLPQAALR
jgi:hypothetical protein